MKKAESILLIRGKREEDYLRVLYRLKERRKIIRVKDIAEELCISLPSVVDYLSNLAKKNLITYEKRGKIDLTKEGEERARIIIERHNALKKFLKLFFNLTDEEAEADACYIEHGISQKTLDRVVMFIKFVALCPENIPLFLSHLYYFYKTGNRPKVCQECIKRACEPKKT